MRAPSLMGHATRKGRGGFAQIPLAMAMALGLAYAFVSGMNLGYVFAGLSLAVLWIVLAIDMKVFLYILFFAKPFVDLTWSYQVVSLGGVGLSALQIIAALMFAALAFDYAFRRGRGRIELHGTIWAFIGLSAISCLMGIMGGYQGPMGALNLLLRILDAYLLYFVLQNHIGTRREMLGMVQLIWLSTFLVGLLSLALYYVGIYEVDISQGVTRFAGLYNDAGGPAYNAVMSVVFGFLAREMAEDLIGKGHPDVRPPGAWMLVLTVALALVMLKLTITRSAMLMIFVFMILWLGLYKRRMLLVLPVIVLGSLYWYQASEELQLRMQYEVTFIAQEEKTIETARSMGSGRVGHWEHVFNVYRQEYSFMHKVFGRGKSFGSHNQYLEYLMRFGLAGLGVFLIVLVRFAGLLLGRWRRLRHPELFMALVMVVMFAAMGLFGHPFDWTTTQWYLMILLSQVNVPVGQIGRDEARDEVIEPVGAPLRG